MRVTVPPAPTRQGTARRGAPTVSTGSLLSCQTLQGVRAGWVTLRVGYGQDFLCETGHRAVRLALHVLALGDRGLFDLAADLATLELPRDASKQGKGRHQLKYINIGAHQCTERPGISRFQPKHDSIQDGPESRAELRVM